MLNLEGIKVLFIREGFAGQKTWGSLEIIQVYWDIRLFKDFIELKKDNFLGKINFK